jgi:DNA polymerase
MSRVFCVLDFETRSRADLKKVGAWEYARHESTRVLCVGYRFGTRAELAKPGRAKVWSAFKGEPVPMELLDCLREKSVKLVAHNAFFEQVITRFVFPRAINGMDATALFSLPHSRWICTASMARALALPGRLAEGCAALNLPVQKDMEGHRLMLKLSKPRKATKHNAAEWHDEPKDHARLAEYCRTDVEAEVALFLKIPGLSDNERKVWLLDQKINARGFLVDRPAVQKVLHMIAEESRALEQKTFELTGGAVKTTNQRAATLAWLEGQGLALPDLRAKTVGDALASGLASGKARELLEVRQAASKTSTAKYAAFEMRSRTDGRVRDNLVYHTASTGRFGGAGVQPQNFPRGTIEDTDLAADVLADPATDLELVRLLYGRPLDVFSSCLRAMIKASPGREFVGGDYAGIEARVLFWIAGHEQGLTAFREERDLYVEMAAEIFDAALDSITKSQRFLGKSAILGCGFGMGKKKFFETCRSQGQEIEPELAERAVKAYRAAHWPVVRTWALIERAAIEAVRQRGRSFKICKTRWFVEGDFLYCELPSGRRLAYYKPSLRMKPTPWGEKRPVLYSWALNPKTRKWEEEGTYGGKLVENVVQAIARDLMCDAMLRAEAAECPVVLTVHDELLTEPDAGRMSVEEFEALMAKTPVWADGLPVKVEGWKGLRYKK